VFVDFAGRTVAVVDGASGEVRQAEVFVAVLGASSFTYACATWTQALPDWIGAHVGAFAYFGGVARQVVSDNLKAGVTRACFHEPVVNRTYAEMAAHYGTAILPARPYKPRDKAKSLPPDLIRGSRSASRSCSAGSWRGCAISGSSRWPR
jgi:transposase